MKSNQCSYIILVVLCLLALNVSAQVAPNWEWAKSIGGENEEWSFAIATDANGNVYTTGYFVGTVDFDPGTGIHNLSSSSTSNADVFVVKLDSAGNFVWATSIAFIYDDLGWSIDVDIFGNVYVAGSMYGAAPTDIYSFVSKINHIGNLVWTKKVYNSDGSSVAADVSGNVYTTGYFWGTANFGGNSLTSVGQRDIFISKLDDSGNYLWTKGIGGTSYDRGYSICTDKSGNVYTTGIFQDTVDFNPDSVATFFMSATVGGYRTFISKLDTLGNFMWAKTFKGNGVAGCSGVTITSDASGNVYTTGTFNDTIDFDPDSTGVFNLIPAPNSYIFLSKLDSSGNFIFAKSMGGVLYPAGKCITVDQNSNIYTTGYFSDWVDFDPNAGSYILTSVSSYEQSFISKLDSSGNFQWVKTPFGMDGDSGLGIVCDTNADNLYVVGAYLWPTLSFGSIILTNADVSGNNTTNDVYIAKISTSCISSSFKNIVSCNSYTSPSGNYIWTLSGIYYDTIPNALGCDSLLTINLTIGTLSSSSSQTVTACDNYLSPSGNYNWTGSGTYLDTIQNVAGCDSVITTFLTISNSSVNTVFDTACTSYFSPSGNYIWKVSGIYNDTIPNAVGCDSVITFHLVFKSTYSSQNINACFSYTSPSGKIWTVTGWYQDTIPNSSGCDSIMTIYANIKTVNVAVTQNGNILTALATGSTYQWLDCNSSFAIIPGATNKIFTATVIGSYAVAVSHINCKDTSTCYSVISIGINEVITQPNFELIPNPATDNITIMLAFNPLKSSITITDVTGKTVFSIADVSAQRTEVSTKEFSDGIYFVQIQTPEFVETKKLIVAK